MVTEFGANPENAVEINDKGVMAKCCELQLQPAEKQ